MTSDEGDHGDERPIPHLTIRTRRTIGGTGDETVVSSVYCPVQERSVAIDRCETCVRYNALHFDPASRQTSLLCRSEASPGPAEEAAQRDSVRGPPDPGTPLADIMSKDVVCVRADVDLDEVKELMIVHGFGGIPVVDEDGKPVGMVSRSDVIRADHDRGKTGELRRVTARPKSRGGFGLGPGYRVYEAAKVTAGEAMNPIALALHESSNIGQASSLMAYEGIHRLPVVSDDGDIVGILSSLDLLRWFGRRSGYLIPTGAVRKHG